MSVFDLDASIQRAEKRLGKSVRKVRSDRGRPRLDPGVLECLVEVLGGQEQPSGSELMGELEKRCLARGREVPSRATVYKMMRTLVCGTRRMGDLPVAVRAALYNVAEDADVPEHLIVFHCFNHGDVAAISYASAMPWLALYQAARMRGFRARSRGLLRSVLRARGMRDA